MTLTHITGTKNKPLMWLDGEQRISLVAENTAKTGQLRAALH